MKPTLHVWTVWHPNPAHDTYEQHRKILLLSEDDPHVWWGILYKPGQGYHEKYFADHFQSILEQIHQNVPTYLFINTVKPTLPYLWGQIVDIRRGEEFSDWETNPNVPQYYKQYKPDIYIKPYWFCLKDFRKIPHRIFRKAEPPADYSRKVFGKEGWPFPCICEFEAYDKLNTFINKSGRVCLNEQEEEEFKVNQFKSRDKINITGIIPKRKQNIVKLNNIDVIIGDADLRLLLSLIFGLLQNKDGAIYIEDLRALPVGINGVEQAISRLRKRFEPALNNIQGTDFIEAWGTDPGQIRLSTHPAFIRYDKPLLMEHKDPGVAKLSYGLP